MPMSQQFYSSLSGLLNSCRLENKYCDIKLVASDGTEFNAHKVVVCPQCPFFERSIDNPRFVEAETSTVTLHTVDENTLHDVIAYLYTGKVHPKLDMALDLLQAFAFLEIESAYVVVESFVIEHLLSVETATHLLALGYLYSGFSSDLYREAASLIRANLAECAKGPDFGRLGLDCIKYLFDNEFSFCPTTKEFDILCVLLKWLDANLSEDVLIDSDETMSEVLSIVNFGKISIDLITAPDFLDQYARFSDSVLNLCTAPDCVLDDIAGTSETCGQLVDRGLVKAVILMPYEMPVAVPSDGFLLYLTDESYYARRDSRKKVSPQKKLKMSRRRKWIKTRVPLPEMNYGMDEEHEIDESLSVTTSYFDPNSNQTKLRFLVCTSSDIKIFNPETGSYVKIKSPYMDMPSGLRSCIDPIRGGGGCFAFDETRIFSEFDTTNNCEKFVFFAKAIDLRKNLNDCAESRWSFNVGRSDDIPSYVCMTCDSSQGKQQFDLYGIQWKWLDFQLTPRLKDFGIAVLGAKLYICGGIEIDLLPNATASNDQPSSSQSSLDSNGRPNEFDSSDSESEVENSQPETIVSHRFQSFDLVSQTVTILPVCPISVFDAFLFTHKDELFLFGGILIARQTEPLPTDYNRKVYRFDTVLSEWKKIAYLPEPLNSLTAVTDPNDVDEIILVGCKRGGSADGSDEIVGLSMNTINNKFEVINRRVSQNLDWSLSLCSTLIRIEDID